MSLANFNTGKLISLAAAAAGTYLSSLLDNVFRRGAKVTIDVTAIDAGTTLTVSILGVDPVSGKSVSLLDSVAIAATGTYTLTVYPGLAAVANATANDVLPKTWQIQAVVAGPGTVTATAAAAMTV